MRLFLSILLFSLISNIIFGQEFSGMELSRELTVIFEKAQANVKSNNYSSAIKNYTKVINEKPDFVKAYINRGQAYYNLATFDSSKYQLAINDFSKAIELDPFTIKTFADRSKAFSRIDKNNEAESDRLHFYKNQNLLKNGDEIKMNIALEKINKVIEANPDKAEGYVKRANVYIKFKRYELAWADLTKSINLEPKNWQPYFDRATVYAAKKIFNQNTIDDLDKAQELASDDKEIVWECLMRKANAHSSAKRIEESLAAYNKAIELKPQKWFAYWERALVQGGNKNFAESIKDFNQVIILDPDNWEAYLYRGQLHKVLGNNNEAESDFKKSASLKNN